MTNHKALTDTQLDHLFEAAQETRAQPSDDLMAKIMADAMAQVQTPEPAQPPSLMAQMGAALRETVGGWPGLAGLATAGVAGLVFGLGSPDTVLQFTGGTSEYVIETETGLDGLMPSYFSLASEG